jgi:two-component system OmpR family response regulator
MNLLFVEDDLMIGESMADLLRAEGFVVEWVKDAASAEVALKKYSFDLMILDLSLPDRDGMDLLKSLRQRKINTPVIITTARDQLEHRIQGLNSGSDDYVVKPYEPDELVARIRAQIRRASGLGDAVFTHQGLRVDTNTKQVTLNNQPVILSAREWAVLETLVSHPGMVFSRSQIEDKLYNSYEKINSNAVEVYIHGLRKKLGSDLVLNIRGLGYMVPKS